ncbi:MAG: 50S ribosomal protein L27 [bacterium]|nr:50S ribosomal protein L27 [bacterium]
MAHKKAGGSTSLGRDSRAQRLGVKLFGGEFAKIGSIVIRQRGTKFHPGINVRKSGDDSLYSVANGFVSFNRRKVRGFTGTLKDRTFVNVQPKVEIKKA